MNKGYCDVKILDWNKFFFDVVLQEPGNRLGVSFIQSQKRELSLHVGQNANRNVVELKQCDMGATGISGVIWDAGMLLVDFLKDYYVDIESVQIGNVLDIGCGTGICGLSACYLPTTTSVTLSDMHFTECLGDNIAIVSKSKPNVPISFLSFDWSEELPASLYDLPQSFVRMQIPIESVDEVGGSKFNTLLCSDVLYDKMFHKAFMSTLSHIQFDVCFISYKKRHLEPEQLFFELLSEWCDVYEVQVSPNRTACVGVTAADCTVKNSQSELEQTTKFSNVNPKMRGGLHIFKIIRKK